MRKKRYISKLLVLYFISMYFISLREKSTFSVNLGAYMITFVELLSAIEAV